MNRMHPRQQASFTLVEIMIVVSILSVVLMIAAPGFVRARTHSRVKACQENLIKIDAAKELWGLENNSPDRSRVRWRDLVPRDGSGYLKAIPICPADPDRRYRLRRLGRAPTCRTELIGHSIDEIGASP